jgi:hypothetical protein
MTLKEPAAEIPANLEYPACPLCGSDRRKFPFRLSATGRIRRGEHEPYRVAHCVECGLHYLYPRLTEAAMHEVYRQSSYYEGGACGYADTGYTAQQSALRATFECLLHNVLRRGLNCGQFP